MLPFVNQFPSHVIHQGRKMPMLCSSGQHGARQSIQDSLQDDEHLFACLDGLHVVCFPERVASIHKLTLWRSTRESRSTWAKRKYGTVRAIVHPDVTLCRLLRNEWPRKPVWRGEGHQGEQKIRVLASRSITLLRGGPAPCNHRQAQSSARTNLARSGSSECVVPSALLCSPSSHKIRGIPPAEAAQFAAAHDDATWSCFTTLTANSVAVRHRTPRSGRLPIRWVAFGNEVPAHWARCADSLRMIHRRHLAVADTMIRSLSHPRAVRYDSACHDEFRAVGYDASEWRPLATAQPRFQRNVSKGCWPYQTHPPSSSRGASHAPFPRGPLAGLKSRPCSTAVRI